MNVFMMNLGEGIGFFFGCWIGIGSSYVSAFNLAATCRSGAVLFVQLTHVSCPQ